MALAPDDPEVLEQLRRRGFAALRLGGVEQRGVLEAARRASGAFLASAGREAAVHRGPARHPKLSRLTLHGLGYVSTPGYADRRQFHLILGASELCPWPSEQAKGSCDDGPPDAAATERGGGGGGEPLLRAAFERGAALLASLSVSLLERVDEAAAAEWRGQVAESGDPSVCDAFLYPASAAAASASADARVAMSSHLDPGWFTIKQGCVDGGLEIYDRSAEAWVNVEEASFYAPHDAAEAASAPEDAVVIFAGERLETWSDGTIPAAPHRALTCPADRVSFIFELRDHLC